MLSYIYSLFDSKMRWKSLLLFALIIASAVMGVYP